MQRKYYTSPACKALLNEISFSTPSVAKTLCVLWNTFAMVHRPVDVFEEIHPELT